MPLHKFLCSERSLLVLSRPIGVVSRSSRRETNELGFRFQLHISHSHPWLGRYIKYHSSLFQWRKGVCVIHMWSTANLTSLESLFVVPFFSLVNSPCPGSLQSIKGPHTLETKRIIGVSRVKPWPSTLNPTLLFRNQLKPVHRLLRAYPLSLLSLSTNRQHYLIILIFYIWMYSCSHKLITWIVAFPWLFHNKY